MTDSADICDPALPRIVDLWSLAQVGEEAAALPLALGSTRAAEARHLLGLGADEATTLARVDGFVDVYLDAAYAQFDPEGRLCGVGYGDYHNGREVTSAVETAVARLNGYGDAARDAELRLGPSNVLRYNGFRAHQFATLPRFIQINRDIQGFELSSWPEDKTITLRRDTSRAAIFATFALKAFKTEYTEHFQLDYCLSWLAAFTLASLDSRIGDRPAPSN